MLFPAAGLAKGVQFFSLGRGEFGLPGLQVAVGCFPDQFQSAGGALAQTLQQTKLGTESAGYFWLPERYFQNFRPSGQIFGKQSALADRPIPTFAPGTIRPAECGPDQHRRCR